MKRIIFIIALLTFAAGSFAGTVLEDLAKPKDYTSQRVSSAWPGGNGDGTQQNPVKPGETRTIADIKCAGEISHIWFTISPYGKETLCNTILRIYWDDEETPSVEAPLGAYFGLGFGREYSFDSIPISVGKGRGLNCFFQMPFNRHARITLENQSDAKLETLYYYIDYKKYDAPKKDILYFHAQYRQAKPALSPDNFVALEATGSGHYVGMFYYIRSNAGGWWGEGDDQFFIDGDKTPTLAGTGMEDYFCEAWGMEPGLSFMRYGAPLFEVYKISVGNENVAYRWHLEDAVTFKKSIRVTQEHGSDNDRYDDFFSVAYWYQTHPHAPFPTLPSKFERLSFAERRQSLKNDAKKTNEYRALLANYLDQASDMEILQDLAESYKSQGDIQSAKNVLEKYAGPIPVEGWTSGVKELAAKLSIGDISLPQSDVTIVGCDNGRVLPVMLGGQRYFQTHKAAYCTYIFLKVTPDNLRKTEKNLVLDVDCYSEKPGRIQVEYNTEDDKYHKAVAVLVKGQQTVKILLPKAKLVGGQNCWTDMRISGLDGDLFVNKITLN